jgi:DNA polymerase gamma 1
MENFGVKFPILNPKSFNLPDFELPKLQASNISDHFKVISEQIVLELRDRMLEFCAFSPQKPPQSTDNLISGWNFFSENGWEPVDRPADEILVFDTETFVKGSTFSHPIMATALGESGYYLWLHPSLVDEDVEYFTRLVPLGQNKVAIAHNSAYDRCRVEESYLIEDNNFWFDTMSAHINCSGLASGQRYYFSKKKSRDELDISPLFSYRPDWADYGSLNNLVDTYKFHTGESDFKQSSKKIRDIFVEAESISEIREYLSELIVYALSDVYYTQKLFAVLFQKYVQSNPSLTTLIGHFEISSSFLPVVDDWQEWLNGCEAKWQRALEKQNRLLSKIALDIFEAYKANEIDVESDPWLSQLDWSMNTKLKKNGQPLSKWYGIPSWLRKVSTLDVNNNLIIDNLTSKSRTSHLLLRLKWDGSPIVFKPNSGWCYLDKVMNDYKKIPHPKKEGENVGSLLSKDFLDDMESGMLSSDYDIAAEILQLSVNVAYWTSARSRVLAENVESPRGFNTIVPQVVPHNTSTNRAGCALWLTVPDPKKDKIGSEIKSRVQAPPGWKLVSSDFDSQEALIASIFSDAHYGIEGSTQFSHSILAGSKDNGTDMHSMTAKRIGISRAVAKGCNYALLFGAGTKTLANTIRQGNKSISMDEASKLAKKLIDAKKGKKASRNSKTYVGGSDSYCYNEMARVASMSTPRNPLSGTKMSTAFRPTHVGDDFWISRQNWVIQSTGSAMLHAFVSAMKYLLRKYNLCAKFCISIHDSITYMAPEDQAKQVAACFQVAHVWCWAWLRHNYGMSNLPVANAWFSSIEIDNILRKSATTSTKTISQLKNEPDGESYNVADLIPVFNQLFL